jgi:Amt family ammonium transporter
MLIYAGLVKKKWAINSAFMAFYAFAATLVVWALYAYNMAFGPQWFPFLGIPGPAIGAGFELGQATIPAAASGMPDLTFPMATLMFFQFVFAAITIVILGGSLIGRMNFLAWVIFVPLWITFIYTVGAFSIWGGGWLASMGALDFSGGYVIHLAAGVSGFVAAAVVGPRLQSDREHFPPNNLLIAMAGAGILWLGWNGFNGGDPYFANANAGGAVFNTNLCTSVALLTWTVMDSMFYGKPSITGAINGMIAGLVGITPAAGYVSGWGAIIIGITVGIIPWFSLNKLQKTALMSKADDTLSVFSTHGMAGLCGGLLTGILADPKMLLYLGTGAKAPGVNATGWFYGNLPQLLLQGEAALFIIALNAIGTYVLLKIISLFVPLRMDAQTLEVGDLEVHGEQAYPLT